MVRIFGTVEQNTVRADVQVITFRIPAFSEGMAKRRAKLNAKTKGFDNANISSVEKVGSASIPGQSEYDVSMTKPVS